MTFLDRLKLPSRHDEASIAAMLEERGATPDEAGEIVDALRQRLSPKQMHVWLSHPMKSHPIPDDPPPPPPEDPGPLTLMPVQLRWTAINAVGAGKAYLVVAEARRYADGATP